MVDSHRLLRVRAVNIGIIGSSEPKGKGWERSVRILTLRGEKKRSTPLPSCNYTIVKAECRGERPCSPLHLGGHGFHRDTHTLLQESGLVKKIGARS